MKKGFTLAEVLITLGIIGVVAAMTMPVLINKYQEIVTVTKVKKFYSLISQALQLSFIDNGYPENWDGTSGGIYEKIKPYLKTLDSCCEACTPEISCDKIKIQADSMTYLNGDKWSVEYNNKSYPKLILSDGTAMWFRGAGSPSRNNCDNDTSTNNPEYGAGNVCGLFWIDTNGLDKAPNRLGKDIFSFYLSRNGLMPHDNASVKKSEPFNCYLDSMGWDCSAWILKYGNMNYPKTKPDNQ